MDATVVIATRDRPRDLERCLRALAHQATSRAFEVMVVDDRSAPPVAEAAPGRPAPLRVLRGAGAGPARAREQGWRTGNGDVVLFTDDDTVPDPGWVEAACAFLADHPDHGGVEGPIHSTPYDPLYALSVLSARPGAFYTANVAYRRRALEQVGGFHVEFPFPHCEDLDLAFRVERLGPVGWASDMAVLHVAKPVSARGYARRGRYVASEIVLFRRHRARYGRARRLPAPLFPLLNVVQTWRGHGRREGAALVRSPRRLARFVVVAAGYGASAALAVARETVRSR